ARREFPAGDGVAQHLVDRRIADRVEGGDLVDRAVGADAEAGATDRRGPGGLEVEAGEALGVGRGPRALGAVADEQRPQRAVVARLGVASRDRAARAPLAGERLGALWI